MPTGSATGINMPIAVAVPLTDPTVPAAPASLSAMNPHYELGKTMNPHYELGKMHRAMGLLYSYTMHCTHCR
jgi:hypothetical protein